MDQNTTTITNNAEPAYEGWGDRIFQFIRDKFEVLILFSLVLIILSIWMRSDYSPTVKEVLMFVLGAMTALMRIVPRPTQSIGINTDSVSTQSLGSATTQEGDIISATAPGQVAGPEDTDPAEDAAVVP